MHVFILLTCLLLLMGCASGLGKIAYVQDGDIWVKELPNGEPKRIATEGDRPLVPRWSPSGQWLLFRDDFTYRRFGVVKGNERQIRLLDDGAPIEDVVWAPGDDRLAYLYYDVELSNKSLVVANADGTKSKGFGKGGGEHGGGSFGERKA